MRLNSDDWNLQQIEAKLRDRVCSGCIDRDNDGACGLRDRRACVLAEKLAQVTGVVLGTQSATVGPYAESIRQAICPRCEHTRPDGSCLLRESDECMLDLYLTDVVETIEEHFGRGHAPKLIHIRRACPEPVSMGCWD